MTSGSEKASQKEISLVLVRYGELVLRGRNLGMYEEQVVHNLRARLRDVGRFSFARMNGRLLMRGSGNIQTVLERARHVFGVHSLSPVSQVPAEMEAIRRRALEMVRETLEKTWEKPKTFRVATKRTDKRFPGTSGGINADIGSAILEAHPDLRVDLDEGELVVGIEIRRNSAFLFTESIPGTGGLPVGTAGKVICLFSAGIDSPVAAYLAMKRGCEVVYVNFHSYPFTGLRNQEKTLAVTRRLLPYQPKTRLYMIPLTEIQKSIREHAKESYRVVLYRRAMTRIATSIAMKERALALVTGDCLSQVASQTLENLQCVGSATPLEVHRPLVGFDKIEIMDLARKIGTYDASHQAEEDCCTVFQPRRPVIRGTVEEAEEQERKADTGALERAAEAEAKIIELDCLGREVRRHGTGRRAAPAAKEDAPTSSSTSPPPPA